MHKSPFKEPDHTDIYTILVIDDDRAIRTLVSDTLDRFGFEAIPASSGPDALGIIERLGLPHLAIVDIMMPGMTGLEFCESVHQYSDLPIILLTAIDHEESVVEGLEHCAEDYVTKPFSPRILVARVRRVLRRIGDFSYALDVQIQVDEHLTVDFVHQQAIINSKQVQLTPIETKLLYILMRNAGKTTSTDFLLRRLWPLEEVFEDALRVHVHRLRQKIESDPSRPAYVVTKRGTGYAFAAN